MHSFILTRPNLSHRFKRSLTAQSHRASGYLSVISHRTGTERTLIMASASVCDFQGCQATVWTLFISCQIWATIHNNKCLTFNS